MLVCLKFCFFVNKCFSFLEVFLKEINVWFCCFSINLMKEVIISLFNY